MKKGIIAGVIIILVLAGILVVINKNKAEVQKQTETVAKKNSAVVVRAEKAEQRQMNVEYSTNGVFSPVQEVMISTETPGKVVRVLVSEGSFVKAGQVLAVIKADKQNVNVANAQAVYNTAMKEVERFENAYASGGVTLQQLDQVKLQLENAKNNLKSAQLTASDVNITASFAGIINKKMVEPGAYANPGQQLFEIVNVSTLKLKINVDEKNVSSMRIGQEVKVTSSVLPDVSFVGVVKFIAPKADNSLNFPVELEIKNNSNNDLKAGMYGTAVFNPEGNVSAFVVPRTAFVGNVSSNLVFVVKDGKAYKTTVVTGRNFGDYVEIISGLTEGDVVVTSGQINLDNETVVEII